jgi:hypothetical protein
MEKVQLVLSPRPEDDCAAEITRVCRRVQLVLSPRPEDDSWTPPTYHEMLDYLCKELRVLGSPNFWEAVQYIKKKHKIE